METPGAECISEWLALADSGQEPAEALLLSGEARQFDLFRNPVTSARTS